MYCYLCNFFKVVIVDEYERSQTFSKGTQVTKVTAGNQEPQKCICRFSSGVARRLFRSKGSGSAGSSFRPRRDPCRQRGAGAESRQHRDGAAAAGRDPGRFSRASWSAFDGFIHPEFPR